VGTAAAFRKRVIAEIIHAEKFIECILFLEGPPIVSNLNKIFIGDEAPKRWPTGDLSRHPPWE